MNYYENAAVVCVYNSSLFTSWKYRMSHSDSNINRAG